jgi:hypothetical protein
MSGDKDEHCPRCGGAMIVRLGEYECQRCGHFMSAVKPVAEKEEAGVKDGAGGAGGTGEARRSKLDGKASGGAWRERPAEAARMLAPPQPAPSHFLTLESMDLGPWRLAAEKRLFLIIAAVALAAGNCAALLRPGAPFRLYFWLVIGALVIVGFLAFALYVDWAAFQRVGVLALIVALAFYAYSACAGWAGYSLLLKIKLAVDAALMIWLATLLWRNSRMVD